MSELNIRLEDMPDDAWAGVFAALAEAYGGSGIAALGIIIFNLEGATVGEITVKDDEATLRAKVTALDAEGHETTFDADPTWATSDDAVAHVTPDPDDPYQASFLIGAPGSAVITVTGIENSSGEDVEIVSTGLINVTAGDATVGSVEFTTGA